MTIAPYCFGMCITPLEGQILQFDMDRDGFNHTVVVDRDFSCDQSLKKNKKKKLWFS